MAAGAPDYDGAMTGRRQRSLLIAAAASLVVAACGGLSVAPGSALPGSERRLGISDRARDEVVIFALGLIDTGYRFGGKNPEAGLDCSGMVSYVFSHAAGIHLTGSAANIARKGHLVSPDEMRPGDLVFFNTLHRSHSHVGIYIGDGRFIHAPSSRGRVRTDRLSNKWFARRFEEARSYLN
jgi:cell wall-associated NlpC family hydrolase